MKAYKAFDQDLKCLNFQYEIGQTYEINEQPFLCIRGFHACLILDDVFAHYPYDPNTRICEVEILGDSKKSHESSKLVTNKIKINKEITEEVLQHGCRTIKNHNGIHYYENYKLHCENGPAVERADGTKAYYVNGQLHREDGPTVEHFIANGFRTQYWYKNGKLHRENGPAIVYANGKKEWYINGEFIKKSFPNIICRIYKWFKFLGCKDLEI